MKRLWPIMVFAAISAAFIGPGTVTTAAVAGATFRFELMWALVFSTVACFVLQEASARLTVASGMSLGQAMRQRFGKTVPLAVVGAVVLGCVAYEAGNILGAVAGAALGVPLSPTVLTLATGALALALLWSGGPIRVARLLGGVVALMGVGFAICAVAMDPPMTEVVRGCLVPGLPADSAHLVLGLVGTTVVPYNLFLGSSLAKAHTLKEVRLGLGIAIPLGGAISLAILVVGTAVEGPFSYQALAAALTAKLGSVAAVLFAFGLFCAGLSSAVTAPLAAALSVKSVARYPERWEASAWPYRRVWLFTLAVGLLFGVTGIKPIPVIILAQGLNGVLLPLVAVFLLIATNDRKLMGHNALNGPLANALIGLSCLVALVLGVSGLVRAGSSALGIEQRLSQSGVLAIAAGLALLIGWPVVKQIRARR